LVLGETGLSERRKIAGDRRENQATSGALRVIPGGKPLAADSAWFCGYCGKPPRLSLPTPIARVCESCFVGVLLEASTGAIPGTAPFMVVDPSLKIIAVSDLAERLLGVFEQDVNGRHVFDFLVSDGDDADGADNFAVAISASATSFAPIRQAGVRLRQQRGVTARLRIATCGPPRAALVVFVECRDEGRPLQLARG
jgi:PAS domain-containing protein